MNAKKTSLYIIVMLLFVSVFVYGCGTDKQEGTKTSPGTNASSEQKAPAEEKAVELKVAHMWPEQHPYAQTIKYFADTVEKESGGKIKLKLFPANSLAQVNEMYEAVADGVADIGYASSSFVAPRMKELNVFEIPGAFDPKKFLEIKDVIKPTLEEIYQKYGVVYLFAADSGDGVMVTKQPIKQVSDLKNLKIRDFGPWVGKSIRQMGATPMTIPSTDLSIALDRGTVDGAYSSWTFIYGYKIYEQAKNVIWTGHQNMWSFLFMNKDSWNKLSPAQQEIMRKAGKMAEEYNNKLINETKQKFLDDSKKAGVTHTYFTKQQSDEIYKLVQPVYAEARNTLGPLANKLLDQLEKSR